MALARLSVVQCGVSSQPLLSNLGVWIDDAGMFESAELLARLVVAQVDVVAEVFLAAFEYTTLLIERGDGSFEAWYVFIVTVGPNVLECNVADTRFGATGTGRAVIRRLLGGVTVTLASWVESRVLSFILSVQLAGLAGLVSEVVSGLWGGASVGHELNAP
eukprot:1325974-Pleurochrysis_carterae.AAC.1